MGDAAPCAHRSRDAAGVGRATDPGGEEATLVQEKNLTLFSPHQVVDWDETRQKLVMLGECVRSRHGKEVQVRFHQMPDGTIDHMGGKQDGSTLPERRNQLSVKFSSDVRFLVGTGSVILPDGTVEGRRAKAFE